MTPCLRATAIGLLLAAAAAADPLDVVLSYDWIGNIDKSGLAEPSGIVYHPGRGTLFLVGDEGDVAEWQRDGTPIRQVRIPETDFEGITCNPATGLLYAAVEGREAIFEIDPQTLGVLREFTVERAVGGRTVLAEGGGGFEGITFVPEGGGLLVLTNQSFDLDSEDDVSALLEIDLPGPGAPAVLPVKRHLPIPLQDLSGLCYVADVDRFWVVSDGPNTLSEIDRDGRVLRVRAFPGDNQEGLALDAEGFLYFAQDSGGVPKLRLR